MKYGDEVGSKCRNCPLFECKLMSRRASLRFTNMFYLYTTKNLVILFFGVICEHMYLLAPLTLVTPQMESSSWKELKTFKKVLLF